MLTEILILCGLIWVPVLLYQLSQRGFIILLAWLFIAPVATTIIHGRANPFFGGLEPEEVVILKTGGTGGGYAGSRTTIRLLDLLEPTRALLGMYLVPLFLVPVLLKRPVVPLDRTETWMAIFSLICIASVLLFSRRLAFGLRVVLDAFIVPFLGYYVTRRLVTSEDRFRQLTRVLGYMGAYIIVLCLIERMVHGEITYRLKGPFGGVPELHIVLTALFFAVLVGEQSVSRGVRWFVLYLTPIVILLTWSRANWVGFLAGVWVFVFLGRRLTDRSRKLQTIGLALLSIAVVVIAADALTPREIMEGRVAKVETIHWRLERWDVALRWATQNPIIGVGLNNSRDVFGQELGTTATSHNSFLSFFTELGTIGLIAYLAIVASIVRMGLSLYRTGPQSPDRWRGIAVICVMASYQISAAFFTYLYSAKLSHLYVYVFLGGIAGLYRKHPLYSKAHIFGRRTQRPHTQISAPAITR